MNRRDKFRLGRLLDNRRMKQDLFTRLRLPGRIIGDIVSPDFELWKDAFDEDEWEELYGPIRGHEQIT